MKKSLLILSCSILGLTKLSAQCGTPVQSISEAFNAVSIPTCWTPGGSAIIASNQLQITSSGGNSSLIVLPMTNNSKGILTFDAQRAWGYEISSVQVGVVSSPTNLASFTLLQTVGTAYTMMPYSVDLSAYTGSYQYLVLRLQSLSAGNPSRRCVIDNVNYTSGCVSSNVTAIAQDITIQLNSYGQATLDPSQIDNGSTSDCVAPDLSVDISNFDCSDVGTQIVTLTATDNAGNTSTATANVTILPAINDETVTANESTICLGSSTTINTQSSVNGINYFLRNDVDNTTIVGPVMGTGNSLQFNTGTINTTTTYNVYAQISASKALDFDGINDRVVTPFVLPTTSTFTIEALIYPRGTTTNRIISSFSTGLSREIILDTYSTANNGKGLRFYIVGGAVLQIANVLTLNTWNHVAATFDNGTLKLFVNGIEVGTSTVGFTSITTNPAYNFCLGEDRTVNNSSFNGKLDEVRFWDVALTASEISLKMNTCLLGTESNLLVYYNFEDGTNATILADNTANNNDGTLTNMDAATDWVNGIISCESTPIDTTCSREMSQLITITVADNMSPVADAVSLTTINEQCSVTSLVAPTATDNCVGQVTGSNNVTLPIMGNSTITWTYDDGNGNTSTQTQDVVITPIDNTTSLNASQISSNQAGASYRWLDCNNSYAVISGETAQTFSPSVNGNYAVEITLSGCTDTSACVNLTTVGINNINKTNMSISPNPVRDYLFINGNEQVIKATIFTINGSLVQTLNVEDNKINVANLSQGMYILVVHTDKGITQNKFIKE